MESYSQGHVTFRNISQRAVGGDSIALAEVFAGFGTALRTYLAQKGCDADEIDEIIQDAYVDALRSVGSADPTKMRGWVFTVVAYRYRQYVRGALNWRRHRSRFKSMLRSRWHGYIRASMPSRREPDSFARLAVALAKMPPEERELISLKHFEGMTGPEIAEELSMRTGAINMRLSRAYTRLRELYSSPTLDSL